MRSCGINNGSRYSGVQESDSHYQVIITETVLPGKKGKGKFVRPIGEFAPMPFSAGNPIQLDTQGNVIIDISDINDCNCLLVDEMARVRWDVPFGCFAPVGSHGLLREVQADGNITSGSGGTAEILHRGNPLTPTAAITIESYGITDTISDGDKFWANYTPGSIAKATGNQVYRPGGWLKVAAGGSSNPKFVYISTIGQVRLFSTDELDAATSGSPAQQTFRWANYYVGSHSSAVRSDMRVDGWLNGTDYRFKFTFLGYNSSDIVIATTTSSYFVDIPVSDIEQDAPYFIHRTGGGLIQRATFSNVWPGNYSGSQLGIPDFGFAGSWSLIPSSGSGTLFGTASGTSGQYAGFPAPWNTVYKTAMSFAGSQYAHWQVDFPAYIVKKDSTWRSTNVGGSAKNILGGSFADAYFLKLAHVGVYHCRFKIQLQPNLLPGYTQSDIASVSTLKKFTKGSSLWCTIRIKATGGNGDAVTLSELPGVIVCVPGDNPLGLYWVEVETLCAVGTNGIFGTLAPTPGVSIDTEDYFEPDGSELAYLPQYVWIEIDAIEGYSFRVYNATIAVDGYLAFGGRIADSSETGNTPGGPVIVTGDEIEQVNDPDTGEFEPEPETDPGSFELEEPATATGACCIGGVCSIKTELDCLSQGGTYAGDGTNCTTHPCSV